MNDSDTIPSPSPQQMHQRIVADFKPLPPKGNFMKMATIVSGVIACFVFIVIPLADAVGELSTILYWIAIPAGILSIYVAIGNYTSSNQDRTTEMKLRTDLEDRFKRMQNWFSKEEPIYRDKTKGYNNKSMYPEDWNKRREYIETRDGGECYLCGSQSKNHQIYRSMTYKQKMEHNKRKYLSKYHQVHHIIPISKGGTHALPNLVLLCGSCHENQHEHMLKAIISRPYARDKALVKLRLSSLERHRIENPGWKLHRYINSY